MRTFLYLIGEPGVGKTTLMRTLTDGHAPWVTHAPFPHIVYDDGGVAQIGVNREAFSGTDGLSMSIQPKVTEWLQQRPYRHLLAEGDRLANAKFFRAVAEAGYELRVAYLVGQDAAAARRLARAQTMHFAPQDPGWVEGRKTKVRNLAMEFSALPLNADLPPEALALVLRRTRWDPFALMEEDVA